MKRLPILILTLALGATAAIPAHARGGRDNTIRNPACIGDGLGCIPAEFVKKGTKSGYYAEYRGWIIFFNEDRGETSRFKPADPSTKGR